MMTESNNLLYHPSNDGFDRLEEMEGGALARIPVLRSVPMPRPWATRGAITLLLVCGVVFGAIALASMNNGSEATEGDLRTGTTNANIGGVTIVSGSSSHLSDNSLASSANTDKGASATGKAEEDSASETSDDSSSQSSASHSTSGSVDAYAGKPAIGSNDGASASSFEEVMIDPLETWSGESQLGSFEGSASDASESQSASASSELDLFVSGSDASVDIWLFDSASGSEGYLEQHTSMDDSASTGDSALTDDTASIDDSLSADDSASISDWYSSSTDDEGSASLFRSTDSSLEL